jgi:hypothetical protein
VEHMIVSGGPGVVKGKTKPPPRLFAAQSSRPRSIFLDGD